MKSRKVLFVIGSLGLGGAESQMVMLIKELIRRGWSCDVFSLEPNGPLRPVLEQYNVVIHDGGYRSYALRPVKIYQLFRALFRLCFLSLSEKPDVVHAYLPLTNFLGALAARISGVNTIITSRRALGTHQDRHPLWKLFDRLANLLSHYVTVNSEAVGHDTIARDNLNFDKMQLIYNGIDIDVYADLMDKRNYIRNKLNILPDTIAVVAVGNLIPYKGHKDLISAMTDIVNGKHNIHFYFIGEDRGIKDELILYAKRLGIVDRITFLGRRDDVTDILSAMDVFVLPSHEEGFSNALLEAMASGLPIVATDVGGNREALEDGKLGILVQPHSPESLSIAINKLLGNISMRNDMGRNAKNNVVKKYAASKMVDAYITLYKKRQID